MRTCSRRAGHTLLEMAVVVSVVSAVVGTTAGVLHGVYRVDRQVRQALHGAVAIERLAIQLRSDAHAAVAIAPETRTENRAGQLTLVLPQERTVRYEIGESAVTRIVRQGERVEHRDTYRLPRGQAAMWQRDEIGPASLVMLVLTRVAISENEAVGTGQRIEAMVGLDQQYSAAEP